MRKNIYPILFIISITTACQQNNMNHGQAANDSTKAQPATVKDPLPSWKDGANKQAIIDFVTNTTKEGSSGFIPVDDRIATFDNDGTLWAERPYVQQLFAFYMVKKMVANNPAAKNKWHVLSMKNDWNKIFTDK